MRVVSLAAAVLAVLGGIAGSAGASGSALSVTVIGIRPGPFSAIVRWEVSAPASVVVEYGLTEDYGVWTRRAASGGDLAGRNVLTALEPARRYSFRVVARAGSARATAAGTVTTSQQPLSLGATVTSRGLAVDGQLIFPRMVWQQCPWAYPMSLAAGVNVFMGVGCGATAAAQLAALRGRALSVTSVEGRQDGPGVIGFFQLDEADARLGRPEDLPLLPSSRTSRRVTFLTLTNHFFSGSAPLPQGRGMYPGMIERAEMVGFNLYPLQIWCRRGTLHAVYEAQRELVALARKPTYQWIEAGPMSVCFGLDPSPALVRAETWLAIAGGARGVGWFPDVWSAPIQEEIGHLSSEIASLAPVLLGDEGEVALEPAETPVRAGVRRWNGATYVIAVNSWIDPATVRMRVPGLRAKTVRVLGSTRSLSVRNETIVDSLRGLHVRIYVAAPEGG